jgi:hypothetical protein
VGFETPDYLRGSVIAEEGFLDLQGTQQMWLFGITGSSNLNVLPENQKNLRTLLRKLAER